MSTKDMKVERVEPTFLGGGLSESQPTIFVTRHTLEELLDDDSEGKDVSKEW